MIGKEEGHDVSGKIDKEEPDEAGKKIKDQLEADIGNGLFKINELVNVKKMRIQERDMLRSEIQKIENAITANNKAKLNSKEKLKEKCYLNKVKQERVKRLVEVNKLIAQITLQERSIMRAVDAHVEVYFCH